MKKLLLIRHAKAANEGHNGDFTRPLKKSGTQDALQLAQHIETAGLIPQMMFTSPALRAKTTAGIITKHLNLPDANQISSIYEASDAALIQVIAALPNEYDYIALTGHNPALSSITTYLTGQYCDMPTCAAVLISFEISSWTMYRQALAPLAGLTNLIDLTYLIGFTGQRTDKSLHFEV